MKVNRIYTNKILKRGLEFASDNSALFAACTTLVFSTAVRPLSILATPKTNRENKEIACAKSIASSLTGYLLMFAISKPFSHSIQKINKEPQKYLQSKTIDVLKGGARKLSESKAYMLATQMFKLGLGMVVAAPKAIITALATPIFLSAFKTKDNCNNPQQNKNVTFTGNKDILSKRIATVLNNSAYQNFANRFKDSNFPMHLVALTDLITTGVFIKQINKNDKIDVERKKPLIHNAVISTGLGMLAGYSVDKLLDKPAEHFINKFKESNKNSPKLDKYVEGIKIAKPILIMGTLYYTIIPIISTFIADRTAKKNVL